ncbi:MULTISPECIES: SGNH/GDSL hydrolase family protein [Niastella]|uniref:SGNH/GDSL hydrolase family protein n=1 Tax=Niastella soli TaxID=2821487 RepID=A0ABS3YWB0_9BACT|nr:SGNH/GDSL hydrolase family protein [Niastella soli]MBO9202221.1 SGNH/GDSL hydrolase family protein [Niastella soli]
MKPVFCIFTPMAHTYSYLALGDSYTIGEGVPVYENFPYQTVQRLRKAGFALQAAEIAAKTGWTTDELQAGIDNSSFLNTYEVVSLLIGVNNQYRGRSLSEYTQQFESLLQQAIRFAGNQADRVFVLSIPDWGVTPFARNNGKNAATVAQEIDGFNAVNRSLAEKYAVHYIDITPGTRLAANDGSLLAADELHPSGKEYGLWAEKLALAIKNVLSKN